MADLANLKGSCEAVIEIETNIEFNEGERSADSFMIDQCLYDSVIPHESSALAFTTHRKNMEREPERRRKINSVVCFKAPGGHDNL